MDWLEWLFYIMFNSVQKFLERVGTADKISFRVPGAFDFYWAVLAIFILAVFSIWRRRRAAGRLGVIFPLAREFLTLFGVLSALALFILALAEPYTIVAKRSPVYKDEAVDFIFDLTPSQLAEDVEPNRLEATKKAVLQAVDKLSAEGISYFCLGYFTLRFNRLLECSDGTETFKETVDRLDPSFSVGEGTNLLAAFQEDYGFVRKLIPKGTPITAVVMTDGGKEMWRTKNGMIVALEPDWKEEELKQRVVELSAKEGVRVIPVGVGGKDPVPVPSFDAFGKKKQITTSDGDVMYTNLDESIIRKIADWSGDKNRYFILGKGGKGENLAEWLSGYIISKKTIDHYIAREELSDLWLYPLVAGIVIGSVSLGALGIIGRFFSWCFRRKS
jgi:hypothetical protein